MNLAEHADLANEVTNLVMEKLETLKPGEAMLVMGNVIFQISDRVNVGGRAGIFFDMPVENPISGKTLSPLEQIIMSALVNKRIARGEGRLGRKKVMKVRVKDGDEAGEVQRKTVDVDEDTEQGDHECGLQSREDQLGVRNIGGPKRDPGRFKIGSPVRNS